MLVHYLNAPIYAIRKTIDETAILGGVEGGKCASFFTGESELSSLLINGNGYTVVDLEELIGEDIEVYASDYDSIPYSIRFIYEGFSYLGKLDCPSKNEKVKYLKVRPN